ncbi:fibronectin type III domain-containing protein, partial [Curtobacterium pusillum]|nr:fibronectin type III domain-containing protein [Curtobacterium pusillum]
MTPSHASPFPRVISEIQYGQFPTTKGTNQVTTTTHRRLGGIAFGLAVTAVPMLALPSASAQAQPKNEDQPVPFILQVEDRYFGKSNLGLATVALQERTWDDAVGATMAVTVPQRGAGGNVRVVDEQFPGDAGQCLGVRGTLISWSTDACIPANHFHLEADGSLKHVDTGRELTVRAGSGGSHFLAMGLDRDDPAIFVGDEARSEAPGRPGYPVVQVEGEKTMISWTAPQIGGKPDLYQVQVDQGGSQEVPAAEDRLSLSDLTVGEHRVSLAAENAVGASEPVTTTFFVMETAVDAVDGEKRTARVSGTAPEGAEIEVDGVRVATADGAGAWS